MSVKELTITCPVCACAVLKDEEQHVCETCSTQHHLDCWEYAGGCAIFGCRKNEPRQLTNTEELQARIAPVNLRLMATWGKVFYLHWISFLLITVGILGMAIPAGAYFVIEMVLHIVGLSFVFYYMFCFFAVLLTMGIAIYVALLPLAALMMIHFKTIEFTLPPGDTALAKSIADRMDMPVTAEWSKPLEKVTDVIVKISVPSLFALIGGGLAISYLHRLEIYPSIVDQIFKIFLLLIFPACMAPLALALNSALSKRNIIVMTFQNRLVASTKQHKG